MHFGSPSLLAGASGVEPTYTAHVLVVVVCDTVAVKPSAVTVIVGPTTPLVVAYAVPRLFVYFTESAKYASSAVIRLRRSDFIDARYAFSFVLANFGIAIAARMPMITTTIRSSISVKPLRFILQPPFSCETELEALPNDRAVSRRALWVKSPAKWNGRKKSGRRFSPPPLANWSANPLRALRLAFLVGRSERRRPDVNRARLGRGGVRHSCREAVSRHGDRGADHAAGRRVGSAEIIRVLHRIGKERFLASGEI